MDISAIKEMIDWFLMRACLFALVVLSGFFLFAVLSRALVRLKAAAKRYGWPIVSLFIVFSSWATYTAFPTAEEKNGGQEAGISSQGPSGSLRMSPLGVKTKISCETGLRSKRSLNDLPCSSSNSRKRLNHISLLWPPWFTPL